MTDIQTTAAITPEQLTRANTLVGHIRAGRASSGNKPMDDALISMLESNDNGTLQQGLALAAGVLEFTDKGLAYAARFKSASEATIPQVEADSIEATATMGPTEHDIDGESELDPTDEIGSNELFLEAVAVSPLPATEADELIGDIRRLVGTDRSSIQKLLPEKSQRGLYFFFCRPDAPDEMPLAHMRKLRSDLVKAREGLDQIKAKDAKDQEQLHAKDLIIDEIDAILRPGPGLDYQSYFEEKAGKSLKRTSLRQRKLSQIKRILQQIKELDEARLKEAEVRRAQRAVRPPKEPSSAVGRQAPTGPTWQEKQAGFKTGPANPQGVPGHAAKRGVTVPHAGRGTKEKGRRQGK